MDNPICTESVRFKGQGAETVYMSRVDTLRDDIQDEVRRLRDGGQPESTRRSLNANAGSVRTTLNKEAVRSAGRDPDDPGAADEYWFEEWDVVVIDLRGDGGEHGER